MRNPLTLEAFADWAEKMPADKPYRYTSSTHCPLAQYLRWLGYSFPSVGPYRWSAFRWFIIPFSGPVPESINRALSGDPETFGELAARLAARLRAAV